ncbi:MAG: hypothetical protein ABEJ43_09700 [Haloferacaceae archaeon]
MCHHHSIDLTDSNAADEEEETAEEGRPPTFEDDRDVDVEIVTDGGDE